ncbi:flagellin [Clostridium transplantifaecale]|uniref:flagellin N-terminal helical domain-containing protein n=1 Tax=Clostridium transplantifaecale TaxID=2479838 RepID=UPI000F642EDF|nr:flagellin [Clostridium transplantifaecale]
MRIQHNIMALNSQRQLGINNTNISKSLEKLSSGYRINRAGDDAAGLAISEKMRAQIKGLETATDNANDAISLIQTAEGGLQEVHSMLNRMTELATKSANGTYDDDVDRQAIQDEFDALNDEIDRIADSTNFNGIKLLDGTLNNASTATVTVGTGANTFRVSVGKDAAGKKITIGTDDSKAGNTINASVDSAGELKIVLGTKDNASTYSAKQIEDAVKNAVQKAVDDGTLTNKDLANSLLSFKAEGQTISYVADDTSQAGTAEPTSAALAGAAALKLQIGDTNDGYNQLNLTINDMKAASLGVRAISVDKLDDATGAMKTIKDAINTVSSQRGRLGALQNRLEHTINNLGVTTENITAAESRIRDVDMAKEMMTFTKNSVLQQSAQAMLAQANQQPQSVLQLLQ